MLVLVASVIACDGDDDDAENKAGQLPVLKVGDTWEYTNTEEGASYAITMEVTGEDEVEGADLYVVKMTIDPPAEGMIDEAIAGFDKELLLPIWMKMSGETEGTAFTAETEATYEISSGSRWPLEVGKEIVIIESTVTNIEAGDETYTENETETKTYKVEAVEKITVEAGTFECFRTVEYDENGEKVSTMWHSDKVKTSVKEIDHETGEAQELISYSVQ